LDSANTPKADRGITKTATDPIMVALVMGFGSFFQNASSGVVTSLFIGMRFDVLDLVELTSSKSRIFS
jgi:hypothetical protein